MLAATVLGRLGVYLASGRVSPSFRRGLGVFDGRLLTRTVIVYKVVLYERHEVRGDPVDEQARRERI